MKRIPLIQATVVVCNGIDIASNDQIIVVCSLLAVDNTLYGRFNYRKLHVKERVMHIYSQQ